MEPEVQVFNYEKSLWDNILLEQLRMGYASEDAIRTADQIIVARRNTFKETN